MAMTYPVKIKFTYSANGGSNAPATFTDTVSTASSYSHAISTSKPTPPSGKYFTRWLVRYNGEIHPQITTNPANYGYISPGGTQSISFPNTYHNSNGREIEMIYYAEYAWNTYAVKYNGNGSTAYPASNVPGQQTKTHGTALTLSSTKPTRTGFTFSGWKDSEGTSYAAGGKYTKDKATTMSAQWKEITYTVSFNAGGGSGQPASQTKYYTSNLTLSTQKPTRTGYSFVNWKASNGTTYNPGGTYSTNAATTMTAQWSELTYTVSYNANNGSGAPASQIKYYTKNLTLQPGVPTRKGYEFLGWATSANATSAAYQPSGTFTTNANTVLYAVWKQVYFAPTITNLTATRAIANGDGTYSDDDEGNIAHVKFNWTPAKYNGADLTSTVYVDISVQGSDTVKNNLITLTPNATEVWITNADSLLSDESAYNVVVRFVTDGGDPVTKTTYISQAYYIMDINKDGTSVAIGGASKDGENKFKVFMPSEFGKSVAIGGSTTNGENKFKVFIPSEFRTPSGNTLVYALSDRAVDTGFYSKREDSGVSLFCGVGSGGVNHGIYSYKLNKWLIHGDASIVLVDNVRMGKVSGNATKVGNYYKSGGISYYYNSGVVQVNVGSLAMNTITARTTIATIPAGFRPATETYGHVSGSPAATFFITTNGEIRVDSNLSGKTWWGTCTFAAWN